MTIKSYDFNKARDILVQAGSRTADKVHILHDGKEAKEIDGKLMLQEARDDFRRTDTHQSGLHSGMTETHYKAIHDAAEQMGIKNW